MQPEASKPSPASTTRRTAIASLPSCWRRSSETCPAAALSSLQRALLPLRGLLQGARVLRRRVPSCSAPAATVSSGKAASQKPRGRCRSPRCRAIATRAPTAEVGGRGLSIFRPRQSRRLDAVAARSVGGLGRRRRCLRRLRREPRFCRCPGPGPPTSRCP